MGMFPDSNKWMDGLIFQTYLIVADDASSFLNAD